MELKTAIEEYENLLKQLANDDISEDDINDFIIEHVTRYYVPIDEKMSICNSVLQSAYQVDKKFKQQKYILKVLYYLCIVDAYTDLVIDFTKPNEAYDLLFRSNFYIRLIDYFADDLVLFDEVLEDTESDYKFNNFELHNFFNEKLNEVGMILETIVQMATDTLSNKFDNLSDEDIQSIKKIFTKE